MWIRDSFSVSRTGVTGVFQYSVVSIRYSVVRW
jgi:hypothetical protein